MEVRILSEEDLEAFRALRLLALKTNPEAFASTYNREAEFPLDRFKSRLSTDAGNFVVGGFTEEKLVCNASFLRSQGEKSAHKGMIVAMYCDRDYRGTGVAQAVMQYLLDEARNIDGLVKVDLTVVSDNHRAKAFYESFGFTMYGKEPMAMFDGEHYVDEYLMTLAL